MIDGLIATFGQFGGVIEFTILVLAVKEIWNITKKFVSLYNKE